jgi:hypothetical protein
MDDVSMLMFLFDDLGYVPNPSYDTAKILQATFTLFDGANTIDLFQKLHDNFVQRRWFINYQEVFSAACGCGNVEILRTMHEKGMVHPETVLPVVQSEWLFDMAISRSIICPNS